MEGMTSRQPILSRLDLKWLSPKLFKAESLEIAVERDGRTFYVPLVKDAVFRSIDVNLPDPRYLVIYQPLDRSGFRFLSKGEVIARVREFLENQKD